MCECVGCVSWDVLVRPPGSVGGGCNPRNARNGAEGNVKTRVRAADHAAAPALGAVGRHWGGHLGQKMGRNAKQPRSCVSRRGHSLRAWGMGAAWGSDGVKYFETHDLRPCIWGDPYRVRPLHIWYAHHVDACVLCVHDQEH